MYRISQKFKMKKREITRDLRRVCVFNMLNRVYSCRACVGHLVWMRERQTER